MPERPVVIIGAPRSGTNMLRDILTRLPGLGTWPCDEINYIWRHGNFGRDSDQLGSELATPRVKSYIRRRFDRIARSHNVATVVEKTCANSLRVSFVNEVLPDARFIFLIRDGRDAVASAAKRWTAGFNLRYTLRKTRFVPITDAPLYGLRFITNRLHRIRSAERRVASWGPRFDGMTEALQKMSLLEVCALQWRMCVDLATEQLAELDSARVHRVRYEDFVSAPHKELDLILSFLAIEHSSSILDELVADVTIGNLGKWKTELTQSTEEAVEAIIRDTLAEHGY